MAVERNAQGKGSSGRARRLLVAGSLVAAALGVGAGPASALEQYSSGCVEWNSSDGCVVTQTCRVNTETRKWACMTWDTRTSTLTGTGGSF